MPRSNPALKTDVVAVHLWRSGESRPEKSQVPHAAVDRVLATAATTAAPMDIAELPATRVYALRTRSGWMALSKRDFEALRLAPAAVRAVHVSRAIRA